MSTCLVLVVYRTQSIWRSRIFIGEYMLFLQVRYVVISGESVPPLVEE